MNKKISSGVGIGAVIMFSVIAIGTIWFVQGNQTKPQAIILNPQIPAQQLPQSQESNQPINQNANQQTADWKTYNSPTQGFQIKYPKNLFTKSDRVEINAEGSGGKDLIISDVKDMWVQDIKKNIEKIHIYVSWSIIPSSLSDFNHQSLEQYVDKNFRANRVFNKKTFKIGNSEAIKFYWGPSSEKDLSRFRIFLLVLKKEKDTHFLYEADATSGFQKDDPSTSDNFILMSRILDTLTLK